MGSKSREFLRSKKALAVPVTYLLLFASLMALISITYGFAVARIGSRGTALKASAARQNMLFLDEAVQSVAWSSGASRVVSMDDFGGVFKTSPSAKSLVLSMMDGRLFNETVFNGTVGMAYCELEASDPGYEGFFMKGDERAILNSSGFSVAQLYFVTDHAQRLVLCYRPFATAAAIGTVNGRPATLVRAYIASLNSTQSLIAQGSFHLRVTSEHIITETRQYIFNESTSSIALKAACDGRADTVWLPVQSGPEGAAVQLEIVTCSISIQRMEV